VTPRFQGLGVPLRIPLARPARVAQTLENTMPLPRIQVLDIDSWIDSHVHRFLRWQHPDHGHQLLEPLPSQAELIRRAQVVFTFVS
jgi:hypothetical protein